MPGCAHHLILEVHHIQFYARHGQTVPDNLVCLGSKRHRNGHEGHLPIQGQAPHNLTFRDASGRDRQRQSQLHLAEWLDFPPSQHRTHLRLSRPRRTQAVPQPPPQTTDPPRVSRSEVDFSLRLNRTGGELKRQFHHSLSLALHQDFTVGFQVALCLGRGFDGDIFTGRKVVGLRT